MQYTLFLWTYLFETSLFPSRSKGVQLFTILNPFLSTQPPKLVSMMMLLPRFSPFPPQKLWIPFENFHPQGTKIMGLMLNPFLACGPHVIFGCGAEAGGSKFAALKNCGPILTRSLLRVRIDRDTFSMPQTWSLQPRQQHPKITASPQIRRYETSPAVKGLKPHALYFCLDDTNLADIIL